MNKTFIFDYDDTLAPNFHDYSQPLLNFADLVIKRIGHKSPDVPTILNLQAEIDSQNVKRFGFTKERFPTSMKETYKEIAKTLGVEDEEGEKISYTIGMQAFNMQRWKEQGLFPGVRKTIDYLKSWNDELILLTKGDDEIQRMKLKANNLESLFPKSKIHIVPKKDKDVIYSVLNGQNLNSVWHVGNSIKSDVLPAIEAGIGAIYIPLETWKHEREHPPLPEYHRLIKINNIEDIIKIYHKL